MGTDLRFWAMSQDGKLHCDKFPKSFRDYEFYSCLDGRKQTLMGLKSTIVSQSSDNYFSESFCVFAVDPDRSSWITDRTPKQYGPETYIEWLIRINHLEEHLFGDGSMRYVFLKDIIDYDWDQPCVYHDGTQTTAREALGSEFFDLLDQMIECKVDVLMYQYW